MPEMAMAPAHGGKGGVSHKIQQLLNTLKRPKKNRRPIEDYYHDDESGMCVCVSSNILLSFTSPPPLSPGTREEDPSAPRPVGPTMQPAVGVPLESRQDWHRNLEAAIQHHSSTLAKHPAISVVDPHGKVSVAATYSKERTHAHTHTTDSFLPPFLTRQAGWPFPEDSILHASQTWRGQVGSARRSSCSCVPTRRGGTVCHCVLWLYLWSCHTSCHRATRDQRGKSTCVSVWRQEMGMAIAYNKTDR